MSLTASRLDREGRAVRENLGSVGRVDKLDLVAITSTESDVGPAWLVSASRTDGRGTEGKTAGCDTAFMGAADTAS